MRRFPISLLTVLGALGVSSVRAQQPSLQGLDSVIKVQMTQRQVPGLSLAIIDGGKIVMARSYGVRDRETNAPVVLETLFQAGSISKPVSALGVLRLVEKGKLSLDEDVNRKLVSWKVPDNGFTATQKVTLRRILSHNAGLTVHGFPGYAVNQPVPTLVQVLDGKPPANTAPIRVDTIPGAIGRYSGGGFTVMQQLMIDLSGTAFPAYMRRQVLDRIGMKQSSFEQPQPAARAALMATGYTNDRAPVAGRWHVYPEMAAAGLWTTPSDLARFAIEVQQTLAGKGHGVISPAMARQYVTLQKDGFGLGIAVDGSGPTLRFSHNGRDEGFDAFLSADTEGHGLVVMINANDNSRLMGRIMNAVARTYHWPQATWKYSAPAATTGIVLSRDRLLRYGGYYEAAENQMIVVAPTPDGRGLTITADGNPDETFLPIDSVRFGSNERDLTLNFVLDSSGAATSLLRSAGASNPQRIPRVAPFPSSRPRITDPDMAITDLNFKQLVAITAGGESLVGASRITPGAKRDFAGGVAGLLDVATGFRYVGEELVTGRGIRRHGSEVERVRFYLAPLEGVQRYLLVYLTASWDLTDYDVVNQ